MIEKAIGAARKIVIKVGSNTLSKKDGTINREFMHDFASQCADLIESGKEIVLVSSGDSTPTLAKFDMQSDNSKWNLRDH